MFAWQEAISPRGPVPRFISARSVAFLALEALPKAADLL